MLEAEPEPNLRDALIQAALEIVAERQDADISLREVARRAKVSHNAPYRHFSSKSDLLAAVGADCYRKLRDTLDDAVCNSPDSHEAVRAIVSAFVDFALASPARYRLMIGPYVKDVDGRPRPEVMNVANSARNVLRQVLSAGAADGSLTINPSDPEELSAAVITVWSLVHGYALIELDQLRVYETSMNIDKLTCQLGDRILKALSF
jgi:AcrR family transcriptional regulator